MILSKILLYLKLVLVCYFQTKIVMIKISSIKPNPNNPRVIKDDKFKKLVKSIKEFPKMMELRPMVVNSDNIVLGGNMRLKALKELGYKEIPKEWVKNANDLTEDEQREFIIKDNIGFGEHDWEMLQADWDLSELEDWGLDIPEWESDNEIEQKDLSSTIESLYRIEIICKDEEHQENSYNKLIEQGYECRLLTL